jgi:Ca2+-binding RTX toxin-like protein
MFETLELRRLMSVTVHSDRVVINATKQDDIVTFAAQPESATFTVTLNGRTSSALPLGRTIWVNGLAGHDTISLGALAGLIPGSRISGGAGNDTLNGTDNDDRLLGGPGNDWLDGAGGDGNILHGNGGNDYLTAGNGADAFSGGKGRDLVDYGTRTADLSLTLDAIANDGEAGENDDIRNDIEDLRSGAGDDLLIGSDAPNSLTGGDGADTIRGGGGNDILFDGRHCGPRDRHARCLRAQQQYADELYGEGGDDRLLGVAGENSLFGGDGDDLLVAAHTILLEPLAQLLDGGGGKDTALVDRDVDEVLNVEEVEFSG